MLLGRWRNIQKIINKKKSKNKVVQQIVKEKKVDGTREK